MRRSYCADFLEAYIEGQLTALRSTCVRIDYCGQLANLFDSLGIEQLKHGEISSNIGFYCINLGSLQFQPSIFGWGRLRGANTHINIYLYNYNTIAFK